MLRFVKLVDTMMDTQIRMKSLLESIIEHQRRCSAVYTFTLDPKKTMEINETRTFGSFFQSGEKGQHDI